MLGKRDMIIKRKENRKGLKDRRYYETYTEGAWTHDQGGKNHM